MARSALGTPLPPLYRKPAELLVKPLGEGPGAAGTKR